MQNKEEAVKKTFKTLEVNDIVIDVYVSKKNDAFRKVLAVIHRGDINSESVYVLSRTFARGSQFAKMVGLVYTETDLANEDYEILDFIK